MKKFLYRSEMIIVFTIVWIILNEKAEMFSIITGIMISILVLFFTEYYLLLDDYILSYHIKPFLALKYIGYLIYQIYKSGIISIAKIIKANHEVKIIQYKTTLESDLSICLFASAITLTPGTVTIDKSDNILKILYLDNPLQGGKNNNSYTNFEKILKEVE
ncbi:MAG: Na+/H+ antiporter subunit E [Eubacteriales bacterium]